MKKLSISLLVVFLFVSLFTVVFADEASTEVLYKDSHVEVYKQETTLFAYFPKENRYETISESCIWAEKNSSDVIFEDAEGLATYNYRRELCRMFPNGTYDLSTQIIDAHSNFTVLYDENNQSLQLWCMDSEEDQPTTYESVVGYNANDAEILIHHKDGTSILVEALEFWGNATYTFNNITVKEFAPLYFVYEENGAGKLWLLPSDENCGALDFNESDYEEVIYSGVAIIVKIDGEYHKVDFTTTFNTSKLCIEKEVLSAEMLKLLTTIK